VRLPRRFDRGNCRLFRRDSCLQGAGVHAPRRLRLPVQSRALQIVAVRREPAIQTPRGRLAHPGASLASFPTRDSESRRAPPCPPVSLSAVSGASSATSASSTPPPSGAGTALVTPPTVLP